MKTLWNILAAMALVNLVAIGAGVLWLKNSDRLDKERVLALHAMFKPTITSQKAEADAEVKAAAEKEKAAAAEAKASLAPLTASEQLTARIEATELDRQRVSNLRSQIDALQRALADAQAEVANQRSQVESQREDLARAKAEAAQNGGQEQFEKTLNLITALKPAEARSVLTEILYGAGPEAGRAPVAVPKFRAVDSDVQANPGETQSVAEAPQPGVGVGERATPGKAQVLAYLDAMEERPRTKIMQEFMKTSPKLAADLLESLRVRGQIAATTGTSAP
jgi:hypothetical protein